ncbi:MAG: guanylate kinase [bacterium]|nr:guanylate kinase [bacterium]
MIYPDRKGFPIILSAPSGAGKTTLCRGIVDLHPEIHYSISVTSRPPRSGENDGQDYRFVPAKEFEQMLEAGQLLEWAMVHENYYGTPRKQIDDKLNAGQDVIMDIDTVGARAIKKLYPQAVTIFVLPPTFEELKTRLKGRATDSDEVINKRLNRAKLEMQEIGDFEYWLINDKFDQTVKTVTAIIEAERCKLIRYNRDEVVNVIK